MVVERKMFVILAGNTALVVPGETVEQAFKEAAAKAAAHGVSVEFGDVVRYAEIIAFSEVEVATEEFLRRCGIPLLAMPRAPQELHGRALN